MQHRADTRLAARDVRVLRAMRRLGAVAVLAGGAVHLQQYLGANYNAIPTIGPLFLANAIGSGVVGLALLGPLERLLGGCRADLASAVLAIAAITIALGSLIALFISETGSLFGFSESGYRTPIVVAIVSEVAAVLLLIPVAAIGIHRASSRTVGRPSMPRGRSRSWSERAAAN